MIPERYKQFLLQRTPANQLRHSERNLYTHLCGTFDLLQQWGARAVVCDAGLFHSIYGTRRFRKTAWPIEDRETIRNLIGPEAEFLAYLFCVTDRPKALLAVNPKLPRLRDYHTGDLLIISREILADLFEIEAANLLEQGSRQWLKRLYDHVTAEPKRDIVKHLLAKERWSDGPASSNGGEPRTAGR